MDFEPGARLSEHFYREAVKPVLDRTVSELRYAAALIGHGSDVLGFDTPRSADHNWGPRLMLFLAEKEYERYAPVINETLRSQLPHSFRGYPTNFDPIPGEPRTLVLRRTEDGPINHGVIITTTHRFLRDHLGLAAYPEISLVDWLTCPQQRLLELTSGQVFHDGLGELSEARARCAYYPHDLWLYLLSAQWQRIGQQEPFVGRCGSVGDEVGSRLVGGVLVHDVMLLCFLMERRYAPYSKWFGSAFARLRCAPQLLPVLQSVLAAATWQEREHHLSGAYETIAEMHNDLGITEPLPANVSPFHDRPFLVIHGDRFGHAISAQIADPRVRNLPYGVGSIDQYVHSTDVLTNTPLRSRLETLYGWRPSSQ